MIFWEKRKAVSALYEKKTRVICDRYQLTQMEYDILMFLHNNPAYTTATDIVSVRRLTKSHVSSALKLLEEKGYIRRFYEANNSKTVHIEILESAEGILQEGHIVQMDFFDTIFWGFSGEERNQYRMLLYRIYENIEKGLEEV